jgi:8-amino-7-oxononanoate synthase
MNLNVAISDVLQNRRDSHIFRQRSPLKVLDATHVEIDGRRLVNFASNNYLGLTHHPKVLAAFESAARAGGVGSGAAGLVTGHTHIHAAAERSIAQWKGTDAAVLTSSGFAANLAAVQTLAATGNGKGGSVRFLIDKLSHASLIDAVTSTGNYRVFPHNHLDKLRRLLHSADPDQHQVVITESIFSMDGDSADLPGIVALKREFGFTLLLDEAHAGGVYGPRGRGYASELGLQDEVDISIVTLSKAIGCAGGAICGSAQLCDAIVNFGRPYIFSTSLPPATTAAAAAAIDVISSEPHRQARLRIIAKDFRDRLRAVGHLLPAGDSPIIPIIIGDEEETLAAAARLKELGLLTLAVRPPTVARRSSRLRITLSSEHKADELEELLVALKK